MCVRKCLLTTTELSVSPHMCDDMLDASLLLGTCLWMMSQACAIGAPLPFPSIISPACFGANATPNFAPRCVYGRSGMASAIDSKGAFQTLRGWCQVNYSQPDNIYYLTP